MSGTSEGMRKRWANKAERKRQSERMKKRFSDPKDLQ
jgi:hypothetical protein